MKTYSELRNINVSKFVEKKGRFNYISWADAVDILLTEDSAAYWTFHEPQKFNDTYMVSCTVHAMKKSMTMHLPVMDNMNHAVKNPDSRKINDSMMRCLVKCIATFGIGLTIYKGEDLIYLDDEKSTKTEEVKKPQAPNKSFVGGPDVVVLTDKKQPLSLKQVMNDHIIKRNPEFKGLTYEESINKYPQRFVDWGNNRINYITKPENFKANIHEPEVARIKLGIEMANKLLTNDEIPF